MKKSFIVRLVISVFMVVFVSVSCGWAETATKEECMAKTKEAAKLAETEGIEAAVKQVNDPNGPFVWKDTYVFALNMDTGMVEAHPIKPKLIGKKLTGLKDIKGKMFFVEFIKVAKEKGEGWVSYWWPKPGEKKPSPKNTYVYKVPGVDYLMAAGVYE